MKRAPSRLSKLLIGIATAWVITLLTRTTGGASGGSRPDRAPLVPGPGPQSAYMNLRPKPGEPLREGWSRPAPEKLPHPTYWPMIFGLGIAFFMWGLISNLFVLGTGFTLLVIGFTGWIADLLTEFSE